MTSKQSKYGRRFDEEFKREVAALASQPGATIEQVAVDLGVSSHSVARWRRRWRAQNGGAAPAAPTATPTATAPRPVPAASAAELERENRALRREVAELRQQREILKKHSPSSRKPRDEDGDDRSTRGAVSGARTLPRPGREP